VVVAKTSPIRGIAEARGAICAVNEFRSHSGMNALRALVAPHHADGRFFSRVRITGSHENSIAAVVRSEADICAVDCVTYGLLAQHRPAALVGTRVLCQSAPAPAIPFVTRADLGEQYFHRLQAALLEVLSDPVLGVVRWKLCMSGGEAVSAADYDVIRRFEDEAAVRGYPDLR
jgi:ABC-type phosphate/phosphonate transport system substrate-binding protein